MKLLEFAVPTWKRPEKLRISVSSIADQGCPVVISHHLCDTETLPVVEELKKKYPHVRAVACEIGTEPDYSDSFKQVFGLSEGKYTWTFGDDDVLVPGAVKHITPMMERDEFDFIHVAEVVRTHNTQTMAKSTLLDLCNNIGWLDMTGFISCNIIRTDYLNKAVALPSWDIYAKNAFVQSCALLEVLHDRPSVFYDYALVDSKSQSDDEVNADRWNRTNVGLRYHYVDDALLYMQKKGILGTLKPKFFRYLECMLWDRFLIHIINSYNSDQDFKVTPYLDDLLTRCKNLTTFLEKFERKRFSDEIAEVQQAMIEHQGAFQYAVEKANVMGKLMDNHGQASYEFSYLPMLASKKNPRG